VFRRLPDAAPEFRDTQLSITTAFFDVRISEVAAPKAGDMPDVEGAAQKWIRALPGLMLCHWGD
jgi:hypothetical protein